MSSKQVITVTKPNPNGPYQENLTDAIDASTGADDAGKLIFTGSNGKIDPSLIDGGGFEPPIPATEVSYDNPSYPTVEDALNFLLYVPIQLSLSNDRNTVEIGSALPSVTLSWSVNKTLVSQSLNNGIGSLASGVRSHEVDFAAPGLTSSMSWTLTVSDGTKSANASTSVSFQAKAYWGVSPNATLTNAQVLALASSAFATSRNRSISYDASGGNYPYYCYPTSFGAPQNVVVGGLAFSDISVVTQVVTNAQGFSQEYYCVRFNGIQTGANISVVWS